MNVKYNVQFIYCIAMLLLYHSDLDDDYQTCKCHKEQPEKTLKFSMYLGCYTSLIIPNLGQM